MKDNLAEALETMKALYTKESGCGSVNIRPLLPRDFGKDNWLWNDKNEVVIPNDTRIIIYGIWAKELLRITIEVRHTYIAIFTTGCTLFNEFPTFGPNSDITITPSYLTPLVDSKGKYEFALLGYAVEPIGKSIAPSYTTIVIKKETKR